MAMAGLRFHERRASSPELSFSIAEPGPGPVYMNLLDDYEVPIFASMVGLKPDRTNKPAGSRELALDEKNPEHRALWNDAIRAILLFINGINNISQITVNTGLEKQVVKNNIRTLIFDLVVVIIPDLRLNHMYRATSHLNSLYLDTEMMEFCVNFITNGSHDVDKPHMDDVLKVLKALRDNRSTLLKLQEKHCMAWGPAFDFRRLIIFAQLHGYIQNMEEEH